LIDPELKKRLRELLQELERDIRDSGSGVGRKDYISPRGSAQIQVLCSFSLSLFFSFSVSHNSLWLCRVRRFVSESRVLRSSHTLQQPTPRKGEEKEIKEKDKEKDKKKTSGLRGLVGL
jgi:hypothetical protein